MTEPAAPHATTTLPTASANGARITQLRMIMRRERHRQPPAPATPGR